MAAAFMHNGARMHRTGRPGSAVSMLIRPQEAVTDARDGKLSSKAKRNISKVGKSANRVHCINRQALRRFATAGLARLYPDNPNTSVRHPSALSDCNYGANWNRAGRLRTRFKELVKSARSNIEPAVSSYIRVYETCRRDLVSACCDFSRFPSSICKLARLMKTPLCRMGFFILTPTLVF